MKHTLRFLSYIILARVLLSCGNSKDDKPDSKVFGNVMILYSAGCNSLSASLLDDIDELKSSYLPKNKNGQDVVLVLSKSARNNYKTKTSPVLFRLTDTGKKDKKGNAIVKSDTLLTLPAGTIAASSSTLRTVLEFVQSNFPSKSYGMVFSSHGTGWLPTGYYNDPLKYGDKAPGLRSLPERRSDGGYLYKEPQYPEGTILTKTLGQDLDYSVSQVAYELEVEDMASGIPFKLDYLLIDACLMGGVEVAAAFENVASLVGFSPAEVLTDGFDYTRMTRHLAYGSTPNPKGVCEDYFNLYDRQSGVWHSATITLVDTRNLSSLKNVCKTLFEKYRDQIASLTDGKVQEYGGNVHTFYDLEDILLKAGISSSEQKSLEDALSSCVVYKGCTGQYYSASDGKVHPVDIYSGLSMYLPAMGNSYLDNFYKSLSWNQATGLLK